MRTITPEEAFRAYQGVRDRLPPALPSDRPCRRVATLEAVADIYDVFLLDAFGVLNIGETAIPGTCARVEALQRAGKRVLVVSNAASVPVADLAVKYRRMGYPFTAEDIVSSRGVMACSLKGKDGVHWGVMASERARLDDLGGLSTVLLADRPEDYAQAGGFLLIATGTWTEERQSMLEDALRAEPRPVLVANPDIAAPRETGFSIEPGHYAHRLADRTGIDPVFFGKPFGNIYDRVFDRIGEVDRTRVLMVGDSLHTDILGAHCAGIASALVADYGFFAGRDVEEAIRETGIVPDLIVDRP